MEAIFVEGFESFDAATAPFMEVDDLAGGCRAYREWALANPTQYMVMFGRAVPDFVPSGDALGRALQSFHGLADVIRPSPLATTISSAPTASSPPSTGA